MAPKDQDDAWDGSDDEEESEEYELLADQSQSVFPLRINRVLTAHLVANTLPAVELSAGIEALAKCFYDPNVEWAVLGQSPPGWTLVKEFVNVILSGVVEKFYRVDIFLRANSEVPEHLFACLFNAMYAMAGFTNVVAQYGEVFEDTHDGELVSLVSAVYSLLDARAAIYKQEYATVLPDLAPLIKSAIEYVKAIAPMELSDGESDDEEEQYIHLRNAHNGQVWHSYLVQLLVGLGFIENVVKIVSQPKLHSLHTCLRLLDLMWLVVQLRRNICHCPIKEEQKATIHRGVSELLKFVAEETLCDAKAFEKAYGGRDRSCLVLTGVLRTCSDMAESLGLPNAQVALVQRLLISQLLKSSNFSRLLTAVTECTQLLHYTAQRTAEAAKEAARVAAAEAGMEVEGGGQGGVAVEGVELPPDVVGLQEVVAWMDGEDIVRQMLRVNLHQSQYAEAVKALLQLLAKHNCLSDAHLDMLWGVTEQEETFDAVKTNVCGMVKDLAGLLRPDQLELLLNKFQFQGRKRASSASGQAGGAAGAGGGGGGRAMTTSDTLRLLDVLKLLAASDTKRASSMAGKLTELVWELTTPADAPPELLASGVMQEVLQCYRQHALLTEYISRCIGQLRSRTNVYTALTVLGNLLRLWGKLYGWEAQRSRQGARQPGPRPLPELLGSLDREPPAPPPGAPPPAPPLSRLLVENLVDFMAGAARWLEERRAEASTPATAAAVGAGPGPSGSAGVAPPGGGSGGSGAPQLVPPGQGCYSYQQIVRRYVETFRLVSRCKDSFVELRLVEALWDGVVLRPNTPEDMPTGLDFIVTCAGTEEEQPQEEGEEEAEGAGMPGPLLDFGDLAALLRDRVCRLPVDNLAQPAFACFKACLHGAKAGLEEHLTTLAAHPNRAARHGGLDEQATITLLEEVRTLGQDYLWQIVLDCQRAEVTSAAFDMLIVQVYGRDRLHDMVRDTRRRLMDAAARLTGAPAGTCAWEGVELPGGGEGAAEAGAGAGAGAGPDGGDVVMAGADGELGWETAKTRATRCLQLLEKLASKAEDTMPPVPAHSCSWQGPPLNLDLNIPEHGRIRLGVSQNEYVGLLRRKVAARIGVEPAYVRLIVSGQELRPDSREVFAALPASWSARQPLLVQVSQRPNKFSRFGEEWWAEWHGRSTLAVMHHDEQLYRVLLLLADLPRAPAVRAAAGRLLQQLPTCGWVPAALLEALQAGQGQAGEQAAAALRRLLLGPGADGGEGSRGGGVKRPGLLLYTLQALYALMNPNYPPDLLPLVAKPWSPTPPPQQQPQPQQAAAADGAEDGTPAAQLPQPQALLPQPQPPLLQAYVAGGAMGDRLMPVLARCLPLLADVVERVMGPAAETAAAAVEAAAAGRPTNLQPAEGGRDLSFIKDFQWVMVFLLCTIHNRARKGAPADGAAAAVAAGVGSRAHPADSMSSSHGPNDGGAGGAPSTSLAPGGAAGGPGGAAGGAGGGPRPAASGGGQDSEAATQEAEGLGAGAHAAATPEVTSADAEAAATVGPGAGQGGAGGSGGALGGAGSSGTAAAAAALVSGLAVSSRNSPDVAPAGAGRVGRGAAPVAAPMADVDMVGQGHEQERGDSAQPQPCPSVSMAAAPSQGPLPMMFSPGAAASVSMGPGGGGGGGGAGGTGPNTGTGTPACATPHAHGGNGGVFHNGGNGHAAAAAAALPGGGSGASASEVAAALVAHYLGAEGLRCLVALLVRLSHDAGRLWGYGPLLRAAQQQQQEAAAAGDGGGASASPAGAAAAAAVAGGSCGWAVLVSASDVATKLAGKALQALGRLINKDELREVFMDDPSAVPMIRETLCCGFSASIRESALAQLEAVFASPLGSSGGGAAAAAGAGGAGGAAAAAAGGVLGLGGGVGGVGLLPPGHYMWVLRALVGLRPDMEARLESCLEFHCLLCKVLHQLPALASAGADARLLADGLLAEEVAALDADATELLAPRRGLLLRGKLMLVQELVRVLDRLGLGLGANGRPGLISLLLNRYLFPEAVPLWQPDAGHEAMEAALAHVAADGGVRRQALALVGCLMTGCAANLEAGLRDLTALHYDNGLRITDRKFDIAGDGVRSLGPGSYVGLRNGGATCYMNAVLQQLFMQPRIRARVLGAAAVDPEELQDSVFHQLQVIFAHLGLGRATCFHPRGFWNSFKDYDGQPIDVREHQDAYEFFTRLQDTVDSHLRSTGQPAAMQEVMGGKFAAQIICKDVPYRSEREEEFYQISVDVKGFNNLEKSLEGYVAGELMEGDNSYFCEELGARVAAVRRTVIKELPCTLVIHLKRFEYDHYNMTRYKLRDRFEFPQVLDMFKYTADGLAALEGNGGAATSEDGTGGGGGGGGSKRQCYLYDLKGIVVHSGTAFAGHYYSFIKERMRPGPDGQLVDGEWFRFDDRVVSPWSVADLEADCFGGRPSGSTGGGGRADAERPYSAYMLFYERRDSPSVDLPADAMRSVPRDVAAAQQREQQQRQQEAAVAAAAAAAATAELEAKPAAADAMDMDTPPPRQAAAAAAPPPLAAASLTPYGLPVLLYQGVLRENLALMHKLHVLCPEYCAFVRGVVESVACEASSGLAGGGLAAAGGGSRTKTRRREHLLAAATAAGSGSGSGHATMSPAGTPPSGGAGGAASAATNSAAAGGAAGAESASSAPSQRSEDADEAVLLAARLAAGFLVNIYLPAPVPLRTELPLWRDLARALLSSSPRAAVELLRGIAVSPAAQHFYFVRYGADGAWLTDLLTHAVTCATRAGSAAAAAAAAGGSPAVEDAAAALSGQLQVVAMELAARLAELTFAPLRDTTRNDPQYVPTCRLLAALAASDLQVASWLIQNHLQQCFTLVGHLLAEAAGSEADLLPELSAALELLHALMRHIGFTVQVKPPHPGAEVVPPLLIRLPVDGSTPYARQLYTLQSTQVEDFVVGGGTAAAAAAAAAEGGGGSAGGAAGGGGGAVSASGFTVLDAVLLGSGLLQVPHALELLRYLLATGEALTCRFLNAVNERLAAPDGNVMLLELVEGLGGAVDVADGLQLQRVYALLFGTAAVLPASLVAMAEAAVAKATVLNWQCMALAGALASVLSRDVARTVVRKWPQPALYSRLEVVMGALMRMLESYAGHEEERLAGQAASGVPLTAREAANAAGTAALIERIKRLLAAMRVAWEGVRPLLQQAKEWAEARRLQQQQQQLLLQQEQQRHHQQQQQEQLRHQQQQRRHAAVTELEDGGADSGGSEEQAADPGPRQDQDQDQEGEGVPEGDVEVEDAEAEAAVGVEPPQQQRGGAGAMERVYGPNIDAAALEGEEEEGEPDAVDVDVEGGAEAAP